MYLWSVRELRTTAAEMLSLTKNTVGNVFAVFRHYCGRDLQDQPVIPFGGRVYVVKCDESQFKHKSKVTHFQLYAEKSGAKDECAARRWNITLAAMNKPHNEYSFKLERPNKNNILKHFSFNT